jgi:hypothetical protein
LVAIYPVQLIRLKDRTRKVGSSGSATLIAFFHLIGNWTEFSGQALFFIRMLSRGKQTIIEYK